jgi:hypothetical protein
MLTAGKEWLVIRPRFLRMRAGQWPAPTRWSEVNVSA